jgi:tellurite resistance protein TehA-like permease
MAATRSQGSFYTLFLVACTALAAGIYLSGGLGMLLVVVGILGILGSLFAMMKIKSEEGKTAMKPGPEGMKWVGAAIALAGWLVTIVGANVISSTGGRIVLALVGIGVSLFGILGILPAAFNKNAVWKS